MPPSIHSDKSCHSTNVVVVPAGSFASTANFCATVGAPLREYTAQYMKGLAPSVTWDLSSAAPRRMSLGALTAFLATAHRLKQFAGITPNAILPQHPDVLLFWRDIGLLDLVSENEMIVWPPHIIPDIGVLRTNPNTIVAKLGEPTPRNLTQHQWIEWKDMTRHEIKSAIDLRCARVFHRIRRRADLPTELPDIVSNATAELVLNALQHGQCTSFVGVQRGPTRITVAVSDSGQGFLSSLAARNVSPPVSSHMHALIAGSLINIRDFGLRRAIDIVTRAGGWVELSSQDAVLIWDRAMWLRTSQATEEEFSLDVACSSIGFSSYREHLTKQYDRQLRIVSPGVRGSRVAFEIPTQQHP